MAEYKDAQGNKISSLEYKKQVRNNRNMVHLNDNLLCAIDTETTGLTAGFHDLVQLAIVPLNSDFDILEEWRGERITPFSITIKPERPENWSGKAAEVTGLKLEEINDIGVSIYDSQEKFERWYEKFELGPKKRIIPLGMNYQFDKQFIQEWIGGQENYEAFFHHQYRDLFLACLYINDNTYTITNDVPFPQPNLKQICSRLDVPYERGHNAMADALLTAECYKRICRRTYL